MEKLTVNKALIMQKDEIVKYKSLPDNLPESKLSQSEKDLVSTLYYKYITRNIDNQRWGTPMYQEEQKEKWPSGPRVKDHEAKRIILSNLVDLQARIKEPKSKLVFLFHSALDCRPMWAKLTYNFFKVTY